MDSLSLPHSRIGIVTRGALRAAEQMVGENLEAVADWLEDLAEPAEPELRKTSELADELIYGAALLRGQAESIWPKERR